MKKLYTFLIALLFVGGAIGQSDGICESCLPDGIDFTTQAQIDSFQINYPGCTKIQGPVFIGDPYGPNNITNLNGLSVLNSFGNLLNINNLDGLSNLTGLDNLTSIGGYLIIRGNDSLTSLIGLGDITSVQALNIVGNNSLTSLEGIDNLTSMGALIISFNNSLTSLTGLESITLISGLLDISYNDGLTNLTGLQNVNSDLIEAIFINNNKNLSICDVKVVCDCIANYNCDAEINVNAQGCITPDEVLDSCEAHSGIIDALSLVNGVSIYPNPSQLTITIELPTQPSKNTNLILSNINGKQLITQSITEPQTEIDISYLPVGIYIVKLWNDKDVMLQKVIKQ